jgi:hypothetical protein
MTKKCGDVGGQLVHALPEKCEAFAQITVDYSTSNLCQQVRGERRICCRSHIRWFNT